ncbi:olfactory receptor 4P4-like [Aplochiton taeniatus]
MVNTTQMSFVLSAYIDIGSLKYLSLLIITFVYAVIIFSNTLLILVISTNRSFHEPMYIFLASLFVNELYGSSAIFPLLMVQLLSDTHTISNSYCFVQIFVLYTYASFEFCSLAVMAYDRYLAICCPLQYTRIMSVNKAVMFITIAWLYSYVKFVITFSLTINLQLCGNIINKVYCDNYLVVKLACSSSETKVNNIYGLAGIGLSIAVPLTPIFFSYINILRICLDSSKLTRKKAIGTCTPHLATLLNFSFGCVFEIIQTRFDMTHVPSFLRIALSLYFIICQPVFAPLVYGLRMSKLRNTSKKLLFCKISKNNIM